MQFAATMKNENLPNGERVGIGMQSYMASRGEIYDRVGHHNLRADLVEHIFNARVNLVVDGFDEDDLFDDTVADHKCFTEIWAMIMMTWRAAMIRLHVLFYYVAIMFFFFIFLIRYVFFLIKEVFPFIYFI